jgi:excisionase family DNA binding protein
MDAQTLLRERVVLTVPEVALVLGIHRNTAYDLVASGVIPSVRLGYSIRVSRVALEAFLAGQKAGTNDGAA